MKIDGKKTGSVAILSLLILVILYQGVNHPFVTSKEQTDEEALASEYEKTKKEYLFCYSDSSMQEFFYDMALDYYGETGVAVDVKYMDSISYLEHIYQASLEGTAVPDAYYMQNDALEEAIYMGIAKKQEQVDLSDAYAVAADAATYEDAVYAWPVGYETVVYVYLEGEFPEQPTSLQSVLDYASENDLERDVSNLFEWAISDEYYDLVFVGDCYTFTEEDGFLQETVEEALLAEKYAYVSGLSEVLTMENTMTYEEVWQHVEAEEIASALISTKDLQNLPEAYTVCTDFSLTEELAATMPSITGLLVENPFGKQGKIGDFLQYVYDHQEDLTDTASVYPVTEESEVSTVYENSFSLPIALDRTLYLKELGSDFITAWGEESL